MHALLLSLLISAVNPAQATTSETDAAAVFMPEPAEAAAARFPPSPEQVLQLPPELSAALRDRFKSGRQLLYGRGLDLLVDFLFQPEGLGMRYRHDATYTVAEAWSTREANCLTFTLLTVALARELGYSAYAQEISDTVAWRQDGNTVFRTHHINAGVNLQGRRFTIDVASDEVIARDPPVQIGDSRLLAHYYNNRAVELMSEGALQAAESFAKMALKLEPDSASSWSNLGVIHLRQGDAAAAERDYKRAVSLDPKHLGALLNLAAQYRRSDQRVLAERIESQLRSLQNRDPFYHFLLAKELENAGNARAAARHYRDAIRLYRYEHRFYYGLARVYLTLDQPNRARRALSAAQRISEGASKDLYQAKLDILRERGS